MSGSMRTVVLAGQRQCRCSSQQHAEGYRQRAALHRHELQRLEREFLVQLDAGSKCVHTSAGETACYAHHLDVLLPECSWL
jgi:hypothetical protein